MNTDEATVVAEVRAAFDAYEAALVGNDVATLDGLFWNDPRTTRFGVEEALYGHAAIAAFRRERAVGDIDREVTRVAITAFGRDAAIAFSEYRRKGSGRMGKQSQTWIRMADGWRIVGAHVSLQPAADA
ncbi:MAG: oxalurate catabolism protein HpxZ [Pseudomonadota bacterium]